MLTWMTIIQLNNPCSVMKFPTISLRAQRFWTSWSLDPFETIHHQPLKNLSPKLTLSLKTK